MALPAYQGDALRVAGGVNLDPVAFVVGQPDQPSDLRLKPSGRRKIKGRASTHAGPLRHDLPLDPGGEAGDLQDCLDHLGGRNPACDIRGGKT
jgi:hypothetical protein